MDSAGFVSRAIPAADTFHPLLLFSTNTPPSGGVFYFLLAGPTKAQLIVGGLSEYGSFELPVIPSRYAIVSRQADPGLDGNVPKFLFLIAAGFFLHGGVTNAYIM